MKIEHLTLLALLLFLILVSINMTEISENEYKFIGRHCLNYPECAHALDKAKQDDVVRRYEYNYIIEMMVNSVEYNYSN